MLSVSYAGKNAYSTGKTSGVLRGGASGTNRCYVIAHCAPPKRLKWYLNGVPLKYDYYIGFNTSFLIA